MATPRTDWLLLALDAAGSKGLTPVQLQKTLFLLGKKMPDQVGTEFYDFKPYHYGPFDRAVYTDAEKLAATGRIEIEQREGENFNRYIITRDGEVDVSRLAYEAKDVFEYLKDKLLPWIRSQTFQSLVSAIYAEYPEMRKHSVFQG